MARSADEDDLQGGVLFGSGEERQFSMLSRGDRVAGRLRLPPGGGPHPILLAIAPDGSRRSDWVDRLWSVWGRWLAIASIDLPLCGDRRSDKLSSAAFDSDDPLYSRLRPDLELQATEDLRLTLQLLARLDAVDSARIGVLAAGLAAELCLRFCADHSQIAAVVLAPLDPTPEPALRSALGDEERGRVIVAPAAAPAGAWLKEAEVFLGSRLRGRQEIRPRH